MGNWIEDEMIKFQADGVIFHDLFDGKDGIFKHIISEYTFEQVKNREAFPKSGRTYYKLVNGHKEFIK